MPILEDKQKINAMAQKLMTMAGGLAEMHAEVERVQHQFGVLTQGISDGEPAQVRGRLDGLKDHVGISRNSANGIAAMMIAYSNGLGR